MSEPQSEPETSTTFDLAALAREMRSEDAYAREGHTARTLVRADDLRVVLIVMRAGAIIREHRANETASIHAIEGQLQVTLRDREIELVRDRMVVLGAGVHHDVRAADDCAFVLTLGWRAKS